MRLRLSLTLALAALAACATPQREEAPSVAPDVALKDLEGRTVTLAGLRGRVVLVDFWASWCVPCRDAAPYYAELQARYPDDLTVLALSVDEDAEELRKAAKALRMPYPVLHDEGGKFAALYDVSMMPTSFLVDRTGRIVLRHKGFVPADRALLDAAVAKEVAAK